MWIFKMEAVGIFCIASAASKQTLNIKRRDYLGLISMRRPYIFRLEENKAIVRRLIEAENEHSVALLDEFIAPNFVDEPNTPFELRGLESCKQFENAVVKAFPDFKETIEDIIAEGDKVWVYFRFTGTHTGEWRVFGITLPPTGKKITWVGVSIFRIVKGKVVERKSVRDMLGFLRQLGVIEYTAKAMKLFPKDFT
ncbi:MAG: ester cyclase [Candidatus Bathycorpusculaceae bacterium]